MCACLDCLSKVPQFVFKYIITLPYRKPKELNMISIINRLASLKKQQIDNNKMLINEENYERKLKFLMKKIEM